jgi:hypothetical protein
VAGGDPGRKMIEFWSGAGGRNSTEVEAGLFGGPLDRSRKFADLTHKGCMNPRKSLRQKQKLLTAKIAKKIRQGREGILVQLFLFAFFASVL